jgi:hypothetical protein
MEVFGTPLYTFDYDASRRILRLTWKPETKDMNLYDFQEALHNFAGFAFDHETRGMLVDVREFRYRPSPELENWRDRVISPRYVKAGLKKFAYVAAPGALEGMKGQMYGRERGFEEEYFEDEVEAIEWLSQ